MAAASPFLTPALSSPGRRGSTCVIAAHFPHCREAEVAVNPEDARMKVEVAGWQGVAGLAPGGPRRESRCESRA